MSKTGWVDLLLTLAAMIGALSALGLLVMKDAYRKLQYMAPLVCLSLPLVVVAIWIQTSQLEARIHAILVLGFLFFTNGVLTHATARANWIRTHRDWNVSREQADVENVS